MRNKLLGLALLFPLALLSCARDSKAFDLFIYDTSDTFMASLTASVLSQLNEPASRYELFDAARNQNSQNSQILRCLERGDALLIVNVVDRLAASAIIEKASSYGAALIFINREPVAADFNGHPRCFYVGSNPEGAGQLQASLAEELFPLSALTSRSCVYDRNGDGLIQIAIIRGEEGHQDTELRTKWCTQKLRDDGYGISILTTETGNWTPDGGYAAMKSIAESHFDAQDPQKPNVELLYCNNDDMAAGAVRYLTEQKILQDGVDFASQPIQIIGVDGTPVGRSLLEKGLMYGTVLNDALTQSEHIARLAHQLLLKEDTSAVPQFDRVEGKELTKALL